MPTRKSRTVPVKSTFRMPTKKSRTVPVKSTDSNLFESSEDSWITSGKFGSRDCVLVFRTRILNAHPKQPSDNGSVNSIDSAGKTASNNQLTETGNPNSVSDCDRSSSEASLFNLTDVMSKSPSKSTDLSTNNKKAEYCSSSKNVNDILYKDSPSVSKVHVSMQKRNGIPMKSEVVKQLMNASLSSSDTSISSECEDPIYLKPVEKPRPVLLKNEISIEDAEQDADDTQAIEEDYDDDREYEDANCPYMPDMPATQLRITYKFISTETKLLRRIFIRHGLSETEDDDNFNILWMGVHIKADILRNLAPYQRVNHFPRSYELTRKDRLYKNIECMQRQRGQKHFDIVPQSFVLPFEYRELLTAHNKQRGPWIVKPAASSRGRGIFIVNTPDQISHDEQVLVSKYIFNPLCIDGHKCDVRVYVLITSFDPLIIYLYEEGLVRLATVKYDRNAESLWNPCMHLCNYSINKYHSDYIKSTDAHDEDVGHKWTLSALLRHLKSQGCDTRILMGNIEDLIIKSILSCAQTIISACRMFVPSGNNCFELYGIDILIDDMLKPWLLEINLSPSLCVDSPLDTKVKACLLTDVLTCIGIPAYSASMRKHYDSKWTRFRGVGCTVRSKSTDVIGSSKTGVKRSATKETPSPPLTVEEQRIIRNARLQNERRGGFVRIFPRADTMQRYGIFLDPATGIPSPSSATQGQTFNTMILPHNFNQMLFDNLYGKKCKEHGAEEGNSYNERMARYERAMESAMPVYFPKKKVEPKCAEHCKRLRHQVLKLINGGSELTQLQARQAFSLYLQSVLRRLPQEPRDCHEKLILKFVIRAGGGMKAPFYFRNPQNSGVISKAHSAMTAKLLGDFLEQYNRDTEAYVDSFDHYGMIPAALFSEFLEQAQEADLEAVLVLVTNMTGAMPYLYNRCGLSVPPTPPIPSGVHGFLKALPAMVSGNSSVVRDLNNSLR